MFEELKNIGIVKSCPFSMAQSSNVEVIVGIAVPPPPPPPLTLSHSIASLASAISCDSEPITSVCPCTSPFNWAKSWSTSTLISCKASSTFVASKLPCASVNWVSIAFWPVTQFPLLSLYLIAKFKSLL